MIFIFGAANLLGWPLWRPANGDTFDYREVTRGEMPPAKCARETSGASRNICAQIMYIIKIKCLTCAHQASENRLDWKPLLCLLHGIGADKAANECAATPLALVHYLS